MGKKLRKKKQSQKYKHKRNTCNSVLQDEKESVCEKRHDYISSLPDEILCNILSRLPIRWAVRTSALSTRWRYLLNTCLADLIVDERRTVVYGTLEEIPSAITQLVRRYDKPWDLFPVFLWYYDWLKFGKTRILQFHFPKNKILLATIKKGGKLLLDFSKGHKVLSPFAWHLELACQFLYFPSKEFSFVKILHLRSVSSLTKDTVSALITNFHFLQRLSIAECIGLQSLHINAYDRLESLTVIDCPQLNNIHISGNKLKALCCRGLLPWFSIKYAPCLVDAMLDFRDGPAYNPFSSENLLSLLLALKNVKILTVTGWMFEVSTPRWLPTAGAIFMREDLWFYNLKELWWIDSSMDKMKIKAMISFLKLCPYLERLYINIDPKCYQIPNASTSRDKATHCFWIDYVNRVACDVRLNHLKIIKIVGFNSQEGEMLLVNHLLKEVAGVEPMIISKLQGSGSARLLKKRRWRRCQKSPRIVETEYDYRIIEEEDGGDFRPTHANVCSYV